jgi:hypothetical protein
MAMPPRWSEDPPHPPRQSKARQREEGATEAGQAVAPALKEGRSACRANAGTSLSPCCMLTLNTRGSHHFTFRVQVEKRLIKAKLRGIISGAKDGNPSCSGSAPRLYSDREGLFWKWRIEMDGRGLKGF